MKLDKRKQSIINHHKQKMEDTIIEHVIAIEKLKGNDISIKDFRKLIDRFKNDEQILCLRPE